VVHQQPPTVAVEEKVVRQKFVQLPDEEEEEDEVSSQLRLEFIERMNSLETTLKTLRDQMRQRDGLTSSI